MTVARQARGRDTAQACERQRADLARARRGQLLIALTPDLDVLSRWGFVRYETVRPVRASVSLREVRA